LNDNIVTVTGTGGKFWFMLIKVIPLSKETYNPHYHFHINNVFFFGSSLTTFIRPSGGDPNVDQVVPCALLTKKARITKIIICGAFSVA